ncbi:hypothetical protein K438DRAFT_25786 [Mycena galopus ATCC 62051]|nr:hypothetical protein K438DRAFT_25786 [Mycena galopus ATCC 62051]
MGYDYIAQQRKVHHTPLSVPLLLAIYTSVAGETTVFYCLQTALFPPLTECVQLTQFFVFYHERAYAPLPWDSLLPPVPSFGFSVPQYIAVAVVINLPVPRSLRIPSRRPSPPCPRFGRSIPDVSLSPSMPSVWALYPPMCHRRRAQNAPWQIHTTHKFQYIKMPVMFLKSPYPRIHARRRQR